MQIASELEMKQVENVLTDISKLLNDKKVPPHIAAIAMSSMLAEIQEDHGVTILAVEKMSEAQRIVQNRVPQA